MKLFIDANVLIAVLNKEYPLFTYAAKILSLSDRKGFELVTSPVCIAIAFYFSSKKSGEVLAKKKIRTLLSHIGTATVDHECTTQAVEDEQAHDLEDGIQYYSALKYGCDHIITENVEDFYFSEIKVNRCDEFLKYELPDI
ncbi:MAG: PIN domain-containing protein [Cyclobacteriaceae bacterium]